MAMRETWDRYEIDELKGKISELERQLREQSTLCEECEERMSEQDAVNWMLNLLRAQYPLEVQDWVYRYVREKRGE